MVSKKTTRQVVPKVLSAASPATSSSTQKVQKSSVLRSAFSPSHFQLSLFASVIQGFSSQQLRIHNSTTGLLQCEHAIGSRARINCLDWGYHGSAKRFAQQQQSSNKKRKRTQEANGLSADHKNVVVAFGTSDSEIHLFSPSEGRVSRVLTDGSAQGIRDFKFTNYGLSSEGWSLRGDGKLVQWNIQDGTSIRIIAAPNASAKTLLPLSNFVLCASNTTYLVNPEAPAEERFFPTTTNAVHSLVATGTRNSNVPTAFLAAAESDRNIIVIDTASESIKGSLVAGNDVESVAYSGDNSIGDADLNSSGVALAVVTKDGQIELFPKPFDFEESSKSNSVSLKSARKNMTRRAAATVRIVRALKESSILPILNTSFQDDDILMAWTEGGLHLEFHRLQWRKQQSGDFFLKGTTDIEKPRRKLGLEASIMSGVKKLGQSRVDESKAIVTNGADIDVLPETNEVINISSGEDEESEDGEEGELNTDGKAIEDLTPRKRGLTNGHVDNDVIMEDAIPEVNEETEAKEAPSFGDLMRLKVPEIVDIAATFTDANAQAVGLLSQRNPGLPTGASLGTVLTQSLRTNDVNLLEKCFHEYDLNIVRVTIERIDSSLATILLQKLAERLHSRPGRAGSLMVWIQWTLIAHGGYLAGQPDIVKKLSSLHSVVKERANSLQPLLALKGKLDMLEAQMNLRKSMQRSFGRDGTGTEDDDQGVIYVEGQEDSDSDHKNDAENEKFEAVNKDNDRISDSAEDSNNVSMDGDEDLEDLPGIGNGEVLESDEEESDSEAERLIDDEASETSADSDEEGSDDAIDHNDVDSMDDEEESDGVGQSVTHTARSKLSNGVISKKK